MGSSHLQQPRRASTSSLSSTGSSSLPEDSEDDLLSDSESRSRSNVQLEAGEDVGQVRAAGRGLEQGPAWARCGPTPALSSLPRESPSPSLGSGVGGRRRDGFLLQFYRRVGPWGRLRE